MNPTQEGVAAAAGLVVLFILWARGVPQKLWGAALHGEGATAANLGRVTVDTSTWGGTSGAGIPSDTAIPEPQPAPAPVDAPAPPASAASPAFRFIGGVIAPWNGEIGAGFLDPQPGSSGGPQVAPNPYTCWVDSDGNQHGECVG